VTGSQTNVILTETFIGAPTNCSLVHDRTNGMMQRLTYANCVDPGTWIGDVHLLQHSHCQLKEVGTSHYKSMHYKIGTTCENRKNLTHSHSSLSNSHVMKYLYIHPSFLPPSRTVSSFKKQQSLYQDAPGWRLMKTYAFYMVYLLVGIIRILFTLYFV